MPVYMTDEDRLILKARCHRRGQMSMVDDVYSFYHAIRMQTKSYGATPAERLRVVEESAQHRLRVALGTVDA